MVSFVSISNGLGGVEKNDLKKFIINLIITKIENTKELCINDFDWNFVHKRLPSINIH